MKGSIVSAVDLLKGIGICAGMNTPEVEGATGYIDTNFEGKANAAIDEWRKGQDLVYIHVEAPDECGHRNEPENKVKAIELIDSRIMPIILDYLNTQDDYKVVVLPDHPTPIATRTHASDPVPYLIYDSRKDSGFGGSYDEPTGMAGRTVEAGTALMGMLFEQE